MEVVVCTRFSFLGRSGWKSDFAQDPQLLFERERLQARFRLFELINLPSLVSQSRQRFHHFILTSALLPDWAHERLQAACLAAYGDAGRFTLYARPEGPARRFLQEFLRARYGAGLVAQVVLDDDDGLAPVFMEDLAPRLDRIAGEVAAGTRPLPYFVSYPFGYALNLRGEQGAELYRHSYDFINLGLTMIARAEERNAFSIDHRNAPRRHGAEIVERRDMFVRSVHGFNDSRVEVTRRWEKVAGWRQDAGLLAAMPCLKRIAAE